MRRRVRALLIAALALVSAAASAEAQSVSLSPSTIDLPAAGLAEFLTGWVDHPGIQVSVTPASADGSWRLVLHSGSATVGASGKPIQDLLWRVEGSSSWTPVGVLDQTIASGVGPATITVYLRLRVRWASDPPGSLSAPLTFSVE